jgi:hypothetical protein
MFFKSCYEKLTELKNKKKSEKDQRFLVRI